METVSQDVFNILGGTTLAGGILAAGGPSSMVSFDFDSAVFFKVDEFGNPTDGCEL